MNDPLKEAAAQVERMTGVIQSLEADRDRWKALAESNANKLIAIREGLREVLEASE